MGFPSDEELKRVREKFENLEPVRLLDKNANSVDRLKFSLCKQIVIYLRENKMTQISLAQKLAIDPARVSEIVKYKIDLFTIDRLMLIAEKLNPKLNVTVAS
jgi:predicted XRE-type DNA-binding protein